MRNIHISVINKQTYARWRTINLHTCVKASAVLFDVLEISGILAAEESIPCVKASLAMDLWRMYVCTPLVPRLCRTPYATHFNGIKRKTHGRIRARKSCCVRPFRSRMGEEGEDRVVGCRANVVVVYAVGSHKGTFRDRRLVIRRRFRKGLFCSRWFRERAPIVYSFFSAFARAPRPIYFRLCSYWSTEISFRLRVILDEAKEVRLIYSNYKSPLCFPTIELNPTKTNIFHLHFFHVYVRAIFMKRIKYIFIILDSIKWVVIM